MKSCEVKAVIQEALMCSVLLRWDVVNLWPCGSDGSPL